MHRFGALIGSAPPPPPGPFARLCPALGGGRGGGGGSLIHLGPLAPCLGIFSSLLCRVVGSGDLSSSVICLCATREFSDDQVPPPVEAQSLNHWVTREVLLTLHF